MPAKVYYRVQEGAVGQDQGTQTDDEDILDTPRPPALPSSSDKDLLISSNDPHIAGGDLYCQTRSQEELHTRTRNTLLSSIYDLQVRERLQIKQHFHFSLV